jgi:hypothetical protein
MGMLRLAALALVPGLITAPVHATQTAPAAAQAPAAPRTPPASVAPTAPPATAPAQADRFAPAAYEVRSDLQELLRQVPPVVADVLRRDPSLLTRADYLTPYPALAGFVAQHPEVPLNPSYFLGSVSQEESTAQARGLRMAENLMDGLGVLVIVGTFLSFAAWLVRTFVEHRRWLRQSKTQVDVHAKVLDKLSTHDDLVAYVQSPAGQKFLEAAPIEVDGRVRPTNSALTRVLWSVQAGIVLLAVGAGLWVAQGRLGDAGQGFSLLSTLSVALGVGFLSSAAAAYVISSRHGLIAGETRAQHE